MSTYQYVQADALASSLTEQLRNTEGFKRADVSCVRALGIYKVTVHFERGKKIEMEKTINNVDVEVVDGTEPPSVI